MEKMIKIIKHGHVQYRMTCEFCDCLFSFEDSDIKFSGNQRDWIEYIECPECGHEIDIVNRAFYKFKESKD